VNGEVILHNATAARWLRFKNPHQVIVAGRIREILPALEQIEKLVNANGWYAAGFLSYEAAAAFDSALSSRASCEFPLLWFGLYPKPDEIDFPHPDFRAYSLGETISSVSKEEYETAIRQIKKYISSGDTYQVNYTLRLRIPFSGDPWHLFLAMVRAQSPGYAAWLDTGRYAVCSASPELFFRLEGNQLTCKPMKGTVKRGRTQNEDKSLADWLHRSEKNRAENLMIVDMIRNDLGRVADTGSVRVPQLFEIERHPTLWQMTSTVTAEAANSITAILGALFPCASITGAPKIRTAQIIAELESTPRGLYTGCIGFVAPGRIAQFNVAIRTAVVDRGLGQIEYGSGGGIVWDSAPGDEYTEALLKARVLTEQRPGFSLLETILWTPDDGYFLLDRHLRRLSESAEYFGYSLDPDHIKEQLFRQASNFSSGAHRIRLLTTSDGSVEIQTIPLLEKFEDPVRVGIARDPINSLNVFLYHKTTNRGVYEAARQSVPDCDDVLLWNEQGELTESSIANVVLEIDGTLWTPPVNSGLLPGTFRDLLLEQAVIHEKTLTLDDLTRCSKIYLINSVRKWREAVFNAPR
jgi:para-aminobenzoate synthetase / 4-amino-4-deoxychorismate lyase